MRSFTRIAALCALIAGATFVAPASAPAAGSSRAVVNINGSNHVISFNGSISGIGALQSVASVETITYGPGVAVCSINGVGNPAIQGECLGESSGSYWSYWRAGPGAGGFSYSGGGAGGSSVTDGAVEGWHFGNGPPPFSSFCAVAGCGPPPTSAPPPPPPVTTPAIAAPAATSSGPNAATKGDQADGAKQGKGSGKSSGKGSGKGSDSGTGDGGSSGSDSGGSGANANGAGGGGGPGAGRDGQQASGPLVSRSEDGGSPLGIAAAAGAFAALGVGGFVLRKRRRGSVALD